MNVLTKFVAFRTTSALNKAQFKLLRSRVLCQNVQSVWLNSSHGQCAEGWGPNQEMLGLMAATKQQVIVGYGLSYRTDLGR